MSENRQLDASLSPQSQQSWKQLKANIDENRKAVGALTKDLKQLEKYLDALKMKQITPVAGQYVAGMEARSLRRVDQAVREGTSHGREIQERKELIRLAREELRDRKNFRDLERARSLDFDRYAAKVARTNDLKRLQIMQEQTLLRLGLDAAKGKRDQVGQAERLNRLIEARKITLQQIALQERNSAKENRFQTARSNRREFLFGDGGAALMGVQAGLLGNYMMLGAATGAAFGTAQFVTRLDESLTNLQAIVKITDNNMKGLQSTILTVAENTRFFSTELADAAVVMGQAGMSAQQIQDGLNGVALLATATGTDLKNSVDIMTSVIGVFDKTANQTEQIANTITQAVNDSKLNIDKLTLGLQYAGNTAAQTGVSFEEMTAALGAIANAGIRSGSTMGTGLRQLMISFQKPSRAFLETLASLGLTIEDVDLKTHGLSGAMRNLQMAGFSASDAIRSFEVRGAAAYNALAGQIDTMFELEKSFIGSTAAIKANEIQMGSLANRGRQLLSTLQTSAVAGLSPIVTLLKDVVYGLTQVVQAISPVVSGLFLIGTSLAALMVFNKISAMLIGGLTGTATAAGAAAGAMTRLKAAMAFFGGPMKFWVTMVGGLAVALYGLVRDSQNTAQALDKLQTAFDNAKGGMVSTRDEMDRVSSRLVDLKNKARNLKDERLALEAEKIREEFKEIGIQIPNTVNSVQELIDALGRLKEKLSDEYILKIAVAMEKMDDLLEGQRAAFERERRSFEVDSTRSRDPGGLRLREYVPSDRLRSSGLNRSWNEIDKIARENAFDDLSRVTAAISAARTVVKDLKEATDLTADDQAVFQNFQRILSSFVDLTQDAETIRRGTAEGQRLENTRVAQNYRNMSPQLEYDIDMFTSRAETRLRETLDPELDTIAQIERLQAARDQVFEDQARFLDQVKTLAEKAEEESEGAGGILRTDFEPRLNGVTDGVTNIFDELTAGLIADLETELEEFEHQAQLHMQELDGTELKEAEAEFAASLAARRDELLSQLVRSYTMVGDTTKARAYRFRRDNAQISADNEQERYREQMEQARTGRFKDALSNFDRDTKFQMEGLDIYAAEDEGTDALETIREYIERRFAERKALLDEALAQAISEEEKTDIQGQIDQMGLDLQNGLKGIEDRLTQRRKDLALKAVGAIERDIERLNGQIELLAAEMDGTIETEKDPLKKAQLQESRNQLIRGMQDDLRGLQLQQIEAYETMGETQKVEYLRDNLSGLDSQRIRQDRNWAEEIDQLIKTGLNDAVSKFQTLISEFDAETEIARRGVEMAAERAAPQDRAAIYDSLQSYLDQRFQERQELENLLLEAATATGEESVISQVERDLQTLTMDQDEELYRLGESVAQSLAQARDQQIAAIRAGMTQSDHEYDQEAQGLQETLDALPTEAFDEKLEIVTQLAQLRQEQAQARLAALDDIRAILEADPATDPELLAELQRETDGEINRMNSESEGFAEQQRRIQIDKHRDNMVGLQTAYNRAMELIELAKTAEEIANAEGQAIELLNSLMAEGEAIGTLEGYTPNQMEELRADYENRRGQVRTTANNRREALNKPAKGSKSGGSRAKEKSPEEQWIETQKGMLKTYESLGERNVVKPVEVADRILKIAAEAEARLSKVDAELMALYAKAERGPLSTEENERLNDLMREQAGLLDLVNTKYGELGAKMILQGQHVDGFRLVFKDWAKEAFDMEKALQDGLINVLNSAISSVQGFFSSITDGSKKGKDAFLDMAQGVLKAIHQMITQMLAMRVIAAGFKWMNSTFGLNLEIPGTAMRHGGEVRQGNTGHIRAFALGGSPNRDSRVIRAQPGEYVLRKSAVDAIGRDELDRINARGNAVVSTSRPRPMEQKSEPTEQTINFYLVDERSQAGSMGPQDILAVVNDDIARGGTTKKLIKSIQVGAL